MTEVPGCSQAFSSLRHSLGSRSRSHRPVPPHSHTVGLVPTGGSASLADMSPPAQREMLMLLSTHRTFCPGLGFLGMTFSLRCLTDYWVNNKFLLVVLQNCKLVAWIVGFYFLLAQLQQGPSTDKCFWRETMHIPINSLNGLNITLQPCLRDLISFHTLLPGHWAFLIPLEELR